MKKTYFQPETKAIKIHTVAILSDSLVGLSNQSQDNDVALGRRGRSPWDEDEDDDY